MTATKAEILALGEELIRMRGYNAFSYQDISGRLGIKNAAVHYYFPKKSDLAIHIIRHTHEKITGIIPYQDPLEELEAVMEMYAKSHKENKVCLVGALAAEYHSLEAGVQEELQKVVLTLQQLVKDILKRGKNSGRFYFAEKSKVKAMLVITNLLAALQIERITGKDEFTPVKEAIIKDLITL